MIGTPKSGKSREIPLNDKVLAALSVTGTFEASWCSATTGAGCCPRASQLALVERMQEGRFAPGSDGTC